MVRINVTKADGTKEKFSRNKIIETCLRSGAQKFAAEKIAKKIERSVAEGTTTHDIYRMIISELEEAEDRSSLLFRLRESVAALDSRVFEVYVKKVLEANGFRCSWNKTVEGYAVEHQIDLIAVDSMQRSFLVECKRHFNPHRYTGLGVCLQVQARFEDLVDGFSARKNNVKLDAAWIFTNTKFSEHAKKYSAAKKIRLTGWGCEKGWEFERLAQGKNVLPVTILGSGSEVKQLLAKKVVTVSDFLKSKYAGKSEYSQLSENARKAGF